MPFDFSKYAVQSAKHSDGVVFYSKHGGQIKVRSAEYEPYVKSLQRRLKTVRSNEKQSLKVICECMVEHLIVGVRGSDEEEWEYDKPTLEKMCLTHRAFRDEVAGFSQDTGAFEDEEVLEGEEKRSKTVKS